jgi:hypothetical protein
MIIFQLSKYVEDSYKICCEFPGGLRGIFIEKGRDDMLVNYSILVHMTCKMEDIAQMILMSYLCFC